MLMVKRISKKMNYCRENATKANNDFKNHNYRSNDILRDYVCIMLLLKHYCYIVNTSLDMSFNAQNAFLE